MKKSLKKDFEKINEDEKPICILDLDQTIISGEPTEEYDFKKNKKKSRKFRFETMEDYYIIFERPNLQKFLDFLFKNFRVCVWTAASKDYALFIIDKIVCAKKNRKLEYIFFSYHCTISKKMKRSSKQLSLLWDFYNIPGYNKNNTFIIDDFKKDVYTKQKNNCILAPPFEFTDENSNDDKFLKELTIKLEEFLKDKNNLKKHIHNINKETIEKYKI
jgi:hypothetical protein